MTKASKSSSTDFSFLSSFCLLFGVDMMLKSEVKLKILAKYFFFVCNLCFVIFANAIDFSDSTYPLLCIEKSVPVAIGKLIQILGLVTSTSIYFQMLFHQKTIWSTEKHLQTADLLFSKLNVRFSYQKFNIVIKLSLIATISFNLVIFGILCIHYGVVNADEIGMRFVTIFHPIILVYLITLLDVFLCWLVRIKLRALSLLLSELCEFNRSKDQSNWKVNLIQENPKIFFTDLIKISEAYEVLYETIGELNSAFGLSCLSSIALESISLTCHVFLLFKAATAVNNDGMEMEMEILAQLLWILLFLVPVMLLIFVYYSTVLEANTVSMVIYETVAGQRIESSSMQLEMDLMALQLLHQKPYFTACGFFNIDMSLAYAVNQMKKLLIIGAVTTYLVILLQFNSD